MCRYVRALHADSLQRLTYHKVLFLGCLCACRPPHVAIRKPLFPVPLSMVSSDYLSIDSPRDLIVDRGLLSVYNSKVHLPGVPLHSPPLPPLSPPLYQSSMTSLTPFVCVRPFTLSYVSYLPLFCWGLQVCATVCNCNSLPSCCVIVHPHPFCPY